ncbi:MAG: SDR family NAD(P)-dependent oxidoreductase [Cellvibrionales bacterium]|jgi:NAD(P)-dependent dehydrogenase (short-subunit alcohol dehydrogenase family)|nr:SDR family NAD(P)-dependent oxidoreductase [Cellvibrionales bacterium]
MKATIAAKHIWITGAGSGIGKSLALAYAKAGNQVVITGRGETNLNQVAAIYPDNITVLVWDVTDDQSCDAVRAAIKVRLGWLDIAIFNAGYCEYTDGANLETESFRRVYEVNVFGIVNGITVAMPLLKALNEPLDSSQPLNDSIARSRSQIVGVGSLSALIGMPTAESYGSSKAAANYLLEALRIDVADQNIDVSVVNPGFVETPMTATNNFPMPFLMDADAAAKRIMSGIEARRHKIQFPRRLHWILALMACFPGLWFRINRAILARSNPKG